MTGGKDINYIHIHVFRMYAILREECCSILETLLL